MAANPRIVNTDIPNLTWAGATSYVTRGTIVDIPAGSALETAYGLANLTPLTQADPGDAGDSEPTDEEGGDN